MNCAVAAQDFLIALGKVYGDGIFNAILEQEDPRYQQKYAMYKQAACAPEQPMFGLGALPFPGAAAAFGNKAGG